MFPRIAFILGWLRRLGASRSDLLIENLSLRQQLAILTAKRPRPRMRAADRFFWVALRRFWPRWKEVLVVEVSPSKRSPLHDNRDPRLGPPRIHGELLMLGFLRNHREVLAAMDLFTVPTATFRVLYVFFVIHHARRSVLHIRVTEHPTAGWIVQQLREAFPYDAVPRYLIFDNDKKYAAEVLAVIDHVIILNERHLLRLLSELVAYYHDDRTHLGLGKDTPSKRVAASKPDGNAEIVGRQRIGGLHHRYEWRRAA